MHQLLCLCHCSFPFIATALRLCALCSLPMSIGKRFVSVPGTARGRAADQFTPPPLDVFGVAPLSLATVETHALNPLVGAPERAKHFSHASTLSAPRCLPISFWKRFVARLYNQNAKGSHGSSARA